MCVVMSPGKSAETEATSDCFDFSSVIVLEMDSGSVPTLATFATGMAELVVA